MIAIADTNWTTCLYLDAGETLEVLAGRDATTVVVVVAKTVTVSVLTTVVLYGVVVVTVLYTITVEGVPAVIVAR